MIIKSGNKFTFKIKPEKAADYDWAVWKNIDNCENISENLPDRFSANDGINSYPTYTSNWDTGLDISKPESLKCQSNGSFNDGLVAALDVNIGDEILLAINLAQSHNGISDYLLSFGGDSGGGGNAEFLCIEEFTPFYICDINNDNIENNFDLNQIKESIINDYLNGNSNYSIKFYLNEKDLVKNTNSINFLDVTNKGTQIFCNIIKPNNDIYSSLSINLNLTKYPVGNDIEDTVCLNQIDLHNYDDLLSATPDKTVLYYDDLSQAEKEAASLIMPININKKTIFYALIKSNKGKCSIIQKLTLQPQSTPQSDPIVICSGKNAVLSVKNSRLTTHWYNVPSGGKPIFTGSVFSLGIQINNGNTPLVKTYYVEQKDGGCISTRIPVTITVNPPPIVNLGAERSICQGSSTTLDAGNAGSSYLWSTGATTQSIEITRAGNYSVVVTNANGCQGKDSVKVTVNALPVVNLGADRSICQGSSTSLDAGNLGSTYLWSTGATTQTIEVSRAGTYSVIVTDANGCQGKGEIKISINPQLSIDLGADRSICQGSSTTLDAGNAGSTYLWSTGSTTQSIEVIQAGTYSVVVTDANGCQRSGEIKISINPLPVVNLGVDRSICQGSSTTLDAGNAGSTYLWSTGATTQSIEVTQAGIYKVTVTNKNGCSSSSSIRINYETTQIKEIKINRNDVEVYAIGKAPLEYSLDSINWQNSPFFTGLPPKTYQVYVRNALGCINGPLFFSILDMPNVITPNGDGINDVWHIKGLEIYSGSSITIFDRYGKLLLKQKIDKEFIWDGKYLGRNLPSSSYWYILDLTDGRRLTGWIAIRNHDSIR
ncbi:T9SS type B sorting domain-containing protein [Apibacter sp. HY039]|uniref:Ig-like domain-containing protein n=1 Tax=Apibacter sp. HY039 TaxID=2501476 RepID=UPI0013E312E2|nr:T9SS type B sorting domain-containing protein [Apibacter sp. HY039]